MQVTYQELANILAERITPERIVTEEAKRLAYGTDASFYRLTPQIVVRLKTLDEVIYTIKTCGQYHIPYTSRCGDQSIGPSGVRFCADHLD